MSQQQQQRAASSKRITRLVRATGASAALAAILAAGGADAAQPAVPQPGTNGCIRDTIVKHAGVILPAYSIVTVVYAPPGCGTATVKCGKASNVDYQTQSKTGTVQTTGSTFSFLGTVTTAVSALIASGSITVGATSADVATDKEEVYKSRNMEINVPGPSTDGIDHDRDQIWVLLNPKLDIEAETITATSCQTHLTTVMKTAQTHFGVTNGQGQLAFIDVGWLKHPETMPAGVRAELVAAHVTPVDYTYIAAADPYSGVPQASPIAGRFARVNTTLPYEPPYAANDSPVATTLTLKNETISTQTSEYDFSYFVDIKATAGATIDGVTGDTKFTWTDTVANGRISDQAQQASATITEPSFGYAGPTEMAVYWDRLYSTFAFVPFVATAEEKRVAAGTVLDGAGHPAAFKEVVLHMANGSTRRSFTNRRGQYKLYGPSSGSANVEVGTAHQPLTIGATPATLNFRLP